MKLVRFGEVGAEKPGILTSTGIYDVSEFCNSYDESFFAQRRIPALKNWFLKKHLFLKPVSDDVRLGGPLVSSSRMICIESNYNLAHQDVVVSQPDYYIKSAKHIYGVDDRVMISNENESIRSGVELVAVIGELAVNVDVHTAMHYVAGYCMHHHIFEYPRRQLNQTRNSVTALGPFFLTQDELIDVNNLYFWLKVNGNLIHKGNTSEMIIKIPDVIAYLSKQMMLHPGDMISIGIPAHEDIALGSAFYLKGGDVVELSIGKLGYARQYVVNPDSLPARDFFSNATDSVLVKC